MVGITGMVTTVTDVLNQWDTMGVFNYVIPFLLIFAVVFAILDKTKMLTGADSDNKAIISIIAIAVGLLSLQFDYVSEFYKIIFPTFGVGLSIFLVLIIFLGFFFPENGGDWTGKVSWIGWVIGIGVVLWGLSTWDQWTGYGGFGGWFAQNIWSVVILGAIIGVIFWVAKSGKPRTAKPRKPKITE